jgi:hypothetical protein
LKPATHAEVLDGKAFHRCERQGAVRSMGYWSSLRCDECLQQWRPTTIGRFSFEDIADRFFTRPRPTGDTQTLVWEENPVTKQHHTKLVPAWDVEGRDKVDV